MKLIDIECKACQHRQEFLQAPTDIELDKCEVCQGKTEEVLFCNQLSVPHNPRQSDIMRKGREIRNKLTGKTPWRKNSESQSS